ncbi:unnamed protein product [Sphagnum jensenii]|uniref:Uncharacterized protein n=1 Tax=Sphagnum jensenii TaxID=128206 RepID=A0ABP0VGE0_9BRYO
MTTGNIRVDAARSSSQSFLLGLRHIRESQDSQQQREMNRLSGKREGSNGGGDALLGSSYVRSSDNKKVYWKSPRDGRPTSPRPPHAHSSRSSLDSLLEDSSGHRPPTETEDSSQLSSNRLSHRKSNSSQQKEDKDSVQAHRSQSTSQLGNILTSTSSLLLKQ